MSHERILTLSEPLLSTRRRGLRVLLVLMSVAVPVSIVHYTENAINYADYPQSVPGGVPNPPDWMIAPSWLAFTAFGVLGLWLFVRGRITAAAIAVAVYSGSGLIGFGHYTIPGAFDMVWWRQAHIVADIICGLLLFAFAIWSVVILRRNDRELPKNATQCE